LACGGSCILIFGVTIGVLLSTSLKSRQSQDDSITGDFLTGTGPAGVSPGAGGPGANPAAGDFPSLLAQGKSALERNDLPQAIEAFKRALAINPDHPEPHAFMGLILSQAGHYDGALMAFDKALSVDPNLVLALWGKGMLLFHVKKDPSGARNNLEKALGLMPPGPEREEVQKTLLEINLPASPPTTVTRQTVGRGAATVSGSVSVDNSFKTKLDASAALFIIARSAQSAGGPPLAVKKIERPKFPVRYTLDQENVMVPGVSFSGKIVVSARLDKDGNAATRQAGDLVGEYKNNPIEVGAQNVDIVIDKTM
jgi:tetratricopeptide (TPR) repeat protein